MKPPAETSRAHVIALPLLGLGASTAFTSYRRWEADERALRLGHPLPYSGMRRGLAIGVDLVAIAAGVIAVLS